MIAVSYVEGDGAGRRRGLRVVEVLPDAAEDVDSNQPFIGAGVHLDRLLVPSARRVSPRVVLRIRELLIAYQPHIVDSRVRSRGARVSAQFAARSLALPFLETADVALHDDERLNLYLETINRSFGAPHVRV